MTQDSLVKEKHPQQNLFICDVADAVLKDFMQQMEHPIYSLSKAPVRVVREYINGDNRLKITPSIHGLPTIYDKDLLIYAVSQLIAKKNRGEPISKNIQINAHDLLVFTNRGTGGKDYKAFEKSLERLHGVSISTNIRTGDEEQINVFGLIDSGTIRRKYGFDGRIISVSMVLSDWVFNAIEAQQVLTLNRDYFRLRKPIERRFYEIARKHCGQQKQWSIGVEKLYLKTGSLTPLHKFRYNIKELFKTNHLPDYAIEYDLAADKVTFKNRAEWWDKDQKPYPRIQHGDTYETAKRLVPSGTDICAVEREWFDFWKSKGSPEIKNPDKAFLAFVSKKFLIEDTDYQQYP